MAHVSINPVMLINFFGFFYGLIFFGIVLGNRRGTARTRWLLSGLIFTLTMIVLISLLWVSRWYAVVPYISKALPPFYFLIGPFLYLYLISLTVRDFTFRKIHFLHFLPFAVNLLMIIPFYAVPMAAHVRDYRSFFQNSSYDFQKFPVLLVLRLVHLLVYLLVCTGFIRSYGKRLKNMLSSSRSLKLWWMKILIGAFYTVFLTYILFFIFRILGGDLFLKTGKWLSIWETVLIIVLSYISLTDPEIFQVDNTRTPVGGPALTPEDVTDYLQRIEAFMEKNKPFLNNRLTIRDLAADVSIPYWHISHVINSGLKKNFMEFVNSYRIGEAKKLLSDPACSQSIIDIAFEVGFNSKSAFNDAFKRLTGSTPTQFKKSVL